MAEQIVDHAAIAVQCAILAATTGFGAVEYPRRFIVGTLPGIGAFARSFDAGIRSDRSIHRLRNVHRRPGIGHFECAVDTQRTVVSVLVRINTGRQCGGQRHGARCAIPSSFDGLITTLGAFQCNVNFAVGRWFGTTIIAGIGRAGRAVSSRFGRSTGGTSRTGRRRALRFWHAVC